MASKFYDPLGFVSPITIQFKMLFRDLCVGRVGWDEPLAGELLNKWKAITSRFDSVTLSIPRCYCWSSRQASQQYSLIGFCDASSRAYAAVVYIRVETLVGNSVEFVKCKVLYIGNAPYTGNYTIAGIQLELLDNIRDLGIQIDFKLKFHIHTDMVVKRPTGF